MQALMKIQGLEKAVKRKCDSYRRKLTGHKITPTIPIRKFVDVNHTSNLLEKDMGSLERYGFGNHPSNNHKEETESTCCTGGCGGSFSTSSVDDDTLHMDFFRNTSLHGLKYIGQKKQHFVER